MIPIIPRNPHPIDRARRLPPMQAEAAFGSKSRARDPRGARGVRGGVGVVSLTELVLRDRCHEGCRVMRCSRGGAPVDDVVAVAADAADGEDVCCCVGVMGGWVPESPTTTTANSIGASTSTGSSGSGSGSGSGGSSLPPAAPPPPPPARRPAPSRACAAAAAVAPRPPVQVTVTPAAALRTSGPTVPPLFTPTPPPSGASAKSSSPQTPLPPSMIILGGTGPLPPQSQSPSQSQSQSQSQSPSQSHPPQPLPSLPSPSPPSTSPSQLPPTHAPLPPSAQLPPRPPPQAPSSSSSGSTFVPTHSHSHSFSFTSHANSIPAFFAHPPGSGPAHTHTQQANHTQQSAQASTTSSSSPAQNQNALTPQTPAPAPPSFPSPIATNSPTTPAPPNGLPPTNSRPTPPNSTPVVTPTPATTTASTPTSASASKPAHPVYDASSSSTIVRYFENPYSCGLLQLKVIRGFDLRLGGTRKPNPFCVIHKASEPSNTSKRLKTKSLYQESDPVWEEEFQIEMPNSSDPDIQIDVFSHNRFFSSDEFIGKVILVDVRRVKAFEGKQLLENEGSPTPGSLSISYQYVPANDRNRNYRIAKEYESHLISFMSHPGLILPSAICDAMISDDSVAVTMTRLLNRDGSSMMLVLKFLREDIGSATQQTQNILFRANTPATKLLAHYFKLIGYQYLVQTLQPLTRNLVADPSHYEVEPEKASPDENLEDNARRLASVIQNLVVAVCNSADNIPGNIKTVLRQVKLRLDELKHAPNISVIALFFLRFVVPAVINPEQYYLASVDEVKPETRRALALVGRVFQWLVNLKAEGATEDKVFSVVKPFFNLPLRSLLEVFISKLLDSSLGPPDQPHSVLTSEDYVKLLAVLVNKMVYLEQPKRVLLESKYKERLQQANFPKSEKKVLKQQFSQMMSILSSARSKS
ncbi:RasGTPase-activating protein [Pelomyxa schiedti]|nr:RasGTPase-activating protein [Pelomyxa schiedti]